MTFAPLVAALALATTLPVDAAFPPGTPARALFDALGTGRVQAGGGSGPVALDASAELEMLRALASTDDAEVVRGLALIRALGATPDVARIEELAGLATEPVSPAALETMKSLGLPMSPALAARLLRPDVSVNVLRAALATLGTSPPPEIARAVLGLRTHADATVATLARVTAPPPSQGPELFLELPSDTEVSRLLATSGVEARRGLVRLLGQGGGDTSLPPLLQALEDYEVRDELVEALSRYGARLVPRAAAALTANLLSETAQVALLHALARTQAPAARDLLMRASELRNSALRNAATRGLWRMGANERLRPDPEWLVSAARAEIDLQTALQSAVSQIGGDGRAAFLRDELREQARMAERRAFALLGLLYDRAELHRALCHLHSENPRSRSNAIELLDQKVRHAALRPLIELVEGRAPVGPVDLVDLAVLPTCPAVLTRMDRWLHGDPDDGLDRAHQLRRSHLFGDATVDAVVALAADVTVTHLGAGETLTMSAGVMVILSGEGTLWPPGRVLVEGDTAGALECLAGEPASGRLEVASAAVVAVVPAARLEEHLTNHPALVRALLRRLGGRLRALNRTTTRARGVHVG